MLEGIVRDDLVLHDEQPGFLWIGEVYHVAIGDAESWPVLTINGAAGASNPTITYADNNGTTIYTTTMTASIGSGVTRILDMDKGTIVDQAAANKQDERSGDFPWALRPWDAELWTPLYQEFYDEDGVKIRELRFADVRPVDGRNVPHLWSLKPLDKEGHETVIRVEKIRYDLEIEETVFTTRNLKRGDL